MRFFAYRQNFQVIFHISGRLVHRRGEDRGDSRIAGTPSFRKIPETGVTSPPGRHPPVVRDRRSCRRGERSETTPREHPRVHPLGPLVGQLDLRDHVGPHPFEFQRDGDIRSPSNTLSQASERAFAGIYIPDLPVDLHRRQNLLALPGGIP